MNILYGTLVTDVSVKWDWEFKRFEARLKPTKIFGGLVSVCAASDIDACAKDAVASNRGCLGLTETECSSVEDKKTYFKFDGGIKIPILLTEGKGLVEAGHGKFSMHLDATLFGVFSGSLSVTADRSHFELTLRRSLNLKQTVDDIAAKAKSAVDVAFKGLLKVTEAINKVENAVLWGIDQICDHLHLDKIGIPGTDINVCSGLKELAKGVAKGMNVLLKPVLDLLHGLVKKATDALFKALGAIFNINGEVAFRVTLSGLGGGSLLEMDAGELNRLAAMDHLAHQRKLEELGLSATTINEKNVVIKGCFGLTASFFGLDVDLPLETTCVMLDLTKVKNIFATIAGKVWEFVKDKLVGRAVEWLKKAWGDFSTRAEKFFTDGLNDAKEYFKDLLFNRAYGRGVGTPISECRGDQVKSGLLCYPKCRSGYSGVGPVCWQSCGGFDAMTVHFAQSQNRMVGVLVEAHVLVVRDAQDVLDAAGAGALDVLAALAARRAPPRDVAITRRDGELYVIRSADMDSITQPAACAPQLSFWHDRHRRFVHEEELRSWSRVCLRLSEP